MIRIYRSVLVILLLAAIGFGVCYCLYVVNEPRSIKDGTLVLGEVIEYATDSIC